jgi:hypothetical protein
MPHDSVMLSVVYADSFVLGVALSIVMLSVIILNVVMLGVMGQ